jgi:hypothetical protein
MSKTKAPKKKQFNLKARVAYMIHNGRVEVTTQDELETYELGSTISYVNKSNVFKAGGFITKFGTDYFVYITPDFETKRKARYVNIKKMWVGDVYTVVRDIVSLAPTKQKKTNFPIKVADVIVFYAQNNYDIVRFKSTDKFKRLEQWVEYFL